MTSIDAAPKPKLRDRIFGPTSREKFLDTQVQAVEAVLGNLGTENLKLSEGLRDVQMMIDANGYTNIFEHGDDGGLTLAQIKAASTQLRELLVGNPFIKRGSQVRNAIIWGGGVEFSCLNRTKGNSATVPADIQLLMEKPANLRSTFGNDAHEIQERAAYTDGNFFLLGNDATKATQVVSLHELNADLRNPDNTGEIWAYRRTWSRNPSHEDPNKRETITRWYYTDSYEGPRKRSITHGSAREIIETGYTMLDKSFNAQAGWPYGVPDGLAVIAWSRLYKEFLVNGYIMSRALARFAYKVTTSSAKGATNTANEVTLPGQAGSTAIEGQGNTLAPLLSAGKGYDFDSGRPLAAAMAAGLEISLVALLSDPGAGGGSYGTAQTLDGPSRAMGEMRRKSWDDFYVRVFNWMGLKKKLVITWTDLPDDTVARIMQAWTLAHNSGTFKPEIIQRGMADVLNIGDPGDVPAGYLTPNNKASQQRKDIDVDGTGDDTSQNPSSATGQGKSSPAGKSQDDHDDDE